VFKPKVCFGLLLTLLFEFTIIEGSCKITARALANLATEEDVSDLLNVYHEYFESNFEDEDEPAIPDVLPEREQLNSDEGDFGMEAEASMKYVSLLYQFGFPTGLPAQFNSRRHRSGVTPWEDPAPFKEERIPVGLDKLTLHWDQLAGVHSILRSLFTKEKDATHTPGVLVGDEVGLGKTAQAITLIAFLNQSILGHNRHIPRVLGEFFMPIFSHFKCRCHLSQTSVVFLVVLKKSHPFLI
jgi:hypothetical protein